MTATVIQCTGIGKTYPNFNLEDIDLAVSEGSVMGFVGPNGAGKSTTLRIIMGLIHPDRGQVRVLGRSIPEEQIAAKRDVGFVSEDMRLSFIMSLPITVREYTTAKLAANLIMFLSVWITLSIASFVVFVGDNGLPDGTIPFVTIVLVGILVAYTFILAVTLVSESIGWSVFAIVAGNLGTQIFLWFVADIYAIRSVIGGHEAIWSPTVIGILSAQVALALGLIGATYVLQARKTDFT